MTFTDSDECGQYAGMPVVDENTRPSEDMIDLYREMAYAKIVAIIGVQSDSNNVAKMVELELVKILINNAQNKANVPLQIPEQQYMLLVNEFSQWGVSTYVPNQDQ